MQPATRIALAAAALLLSVAYVAPLWHIGLDAPQYPEGIGMYIWIDTITGQKPNDLNSINGLNHYIGMKAIVPDAIPELRLMPKIVALLMAVGLMAAGVGRRPLLYLWTVVFAIVAVAGLADFWYWGYDYGHDLDPTAAIKVPGLSYQPPMLGSKKLLNFTAHSWPGLGGLAIIAAFGAAVGLCALELRLFVASGFSRKLKIFVRAAALIFASIGAGIGAGIAAGCAAPAPIDFHYDSDACDHCRMTISQPVFAAQLVVRTGKVFRFDDPGCLAEFVAAGHVAADDVHSIWANDYAHPDVRVRMDEAVVVISDAIRAPMNGRMAIFGSRDDAAALAAKVGGRTATWADVQRRNPS